MATNLTCNKDTESSVVAQNKVNDARDASRVNKKMNQVETCRKRRNITSVVVIGREQTPEPLGTTV